MSKKIKYNTENPRFWINPSGYTVRIAGWIDPSCGKYLGGYCKK